MSISSLACPIPNDANDDCIVLAEGEGGRASRRLIWDWIVPRLSMPQTFAFEDAAAMPPLPGPPVMSTDSFVVTPLFFPGGNIGSLSVYGTVNDLLVRGACPAWLCVAFILEEGFRRAILERVLHSMARAAQETGVGIVAGDTKVVPRGVVDGLFITTTGLGHLLPDAPQGPIGLQPGDQLLVTGNIGRHGIAVLAARESLGFEPPPTSDCGALAEPIAALRRAGVRPRAMRDATRGGVAAVLHEWAAACGQTITIDESNVPVAAETRGVCELLGLDSLHVANEGTMVVAVAEADAKRARTALRATVLASSAEIIGVVRPRGPLAVTIRRALGGEQPLDDPAGAPMPRIC